MTFLLIAIGIFILGFVVVDILITALTVDGGGPATNRISTWLWHLALISHQRWQSHNLLAITGWIILVGIFLVWFVAAFLGWLLIFCAQDTAVVHSSTQIPADFWERVYFVGYTMSTLGIGDYIPKGTTWQLATDLASMSGFLLVSLAIAYLIPVVSAATQQRQLAAYITSLGGTPDEILTRSWNGEGFGQLEQHLINITPMILLAAERHMMYPVLYYFHSRKRSRALALSFVALDEAMTLMQYGVAAEKRPDVSALQSLRRAMATFMLTIRSAYIKADAPCPPLPSLDLLRSQNIPTVDDPVFWSAAHRLQERRRLLQTIVHSDGWIWDSISSCKTTSRGSHLDDHHLGSFEEKEDPSP